jgi:uncharacterized membrane protein YjgN (DUF898 family)
MAVTEETGTLVPEQSTINWFKFHGTGSEYFGIWIVNILLTIVTLGIYSAWAKVRRNRYFYGNLELMGSRFDYHARGGQILKGRLIVFGALIIFNILTNIFPPIGFVTSLIILIALPFLVARGLRFSTRVTSYRNVRFNFVGTAGGAFKAVILGPILTVVTIGLLAPVSTRWFSRYFFNNLHYGGRPFASEPPLRALYKALILPFILFVIGAAIYCVIVFYLVQTSEYVDTGMISDSEEYDALYILVLSTTVFGAFIIFSLTSLVYRAMVRIIVLSSTVFDEKHPFSSNMSAVRYVWVVISNLIVSIATVGLARPWAACRYMRLISDTTSIAIMGDVGTILNELDASGSVASAEFMDIEGIDFGF